MRIAFLVHWRGGQRTGPFRKMAAQLAAWTQAGHTVGVFAATESPSVQDWRQLSAQTHVISCRSGIGKLHERQWLADQVYGWCPEIVYERHGLYYPGHRRLSRRVPIVTEINGNDISEWRLKSRTKAMYNLATRGRGLVDAAGLVFVTNELLESGVFAPFLGDRPSIVLGNGIDLAAVPWTPSPGLSHDPRLIFVGHPRTPWHGIDQLLQLARRRPLWHIDVIGLEPFEVSDIPPNVTLHGELKPPEYAQLLAAADVGVGTLGLYRKNMHEASALKVREYLAAGLPVILGGHDTDFPGGVDFLLEVPNRPDGVLDALPQIDEFVANWRGRRVPRTKVSHLDAAIKEQRRLEFLQLVARRRAR